MFCARPASSKHLAKLVFRCRRWLWEDPGEPPHIPPLFVMSHIEGDCRRAAFRRLRTGSRTWPTVTATRVGLWPPCTACRRTTSGWAASRSSIQSPKSTAGATPCRPSMPRWCRTGPSVRDALLRCAPTAIGPGVVHGDFRLGNLLAVGARINAVIDWEIWSIGDPRIDVGWFLINSDPDTYQRVPGLGGDGAADCRTRRDLPAGAG